MIVYVEQEITMVSIVLVLRSSKPAASRKDMLRSKQKWLSRQALLVTVQSDVPHTHLTWRGRLHQYHR
jgi:hypothetical protein